LKILQIISVFNPKFGGEVNVCYNLSKQLSKNGHSVTILTTNYEFDTNFAQTLQEFGVEIIPCPTVINLGFFIYTPLIKSWLRDNVKNFEVIHMHTFRSYQNNCVSYYALKNNILYLVQAHGSVLPFFEKQNLKKFYDIVWGNQILNGATKVIALTKFEKEQYCIMGVQENKIEIIPNGIDLSQFSNLPAKGIFRSKYGIPKNEKIILFLGRIHKIKGIDLLVDAYSNLLKEIPDATLVIVGPDDNYLSIIDDQIQRKKLDKNPLFTGPLYNQDKLEAYVDADVFVLPSRYEMFGTTILEAWACETPVVVTTGCLLADIIRKAGYVTEFNSTELKNAIVILLSDELLRKKLGYTGKTIVKSDFDNRNVTQKIESLYQKIREGK